MSRACLEPINLQTALMSMAYTLCCKFVKIMKGKKSNEVGFNTKDFNEIIVEIKEWKEAGWRISYIEIIYDEEDEDWDFFMKVFM